MRKAVIVGATSGIGKEVALLLIREGWQLGIAARREEELKALQATAPTQIEWQVLDVTREDAVDHLHTLIGKLGGMDLYVHSSGVGYQNPNLEADIELRTLQTNGEGFTRMIVAAFQYFKEHGGGHIGAISSIAGTKGLGLAPAYSATKRFQNTYIDALDQLSRMEKLNIRFTDIRPGFVATPLLKEGHYPMQMRTGKVAASIVKALQKRKRVVVIDWRYAILVFFWRMIPRWIWVRMPIKTHEITT
ncbi:MAG: SDR family NAD(P)-dependent oxidoreductase [Bacteroides sp.]|nr:SDR family NAD(P)-dependent oxidoreductase [Bacteroides sp.]